jgi:hypothetical protein
MSNQPTTANRPTPASQIVATLNADELRARIDGLDEERAALIVLLRAARARERQERLRRERKGAAHGS